MIEFDHVTFFYGQETSEQNMILNNVSLSIQPGEFVVMMGANGSGKTTLSRCINGLLLPAQGDVKVDDFNTKDEKNLLQIRRLVGMVFQNPDNQIVSTTVEREIAFGLENLGISYEEMHKRVNKVLADFHLSPYRSKSPHYLSGGEKQRLALASVMAMRPKYLVLDEPTSLLDPKNRKKILGFIKNLHKQQNEKSETAIATVLITQFPEEALIADRLVVMSQGKIVMDDSPDKVFQQADQLETIGLAPPVSYLLKDVLKRYNYFDNS